ncbi:hypothetical protein KEF85_04140 [Methylomonas paludis]|uniref:Uncharacterized protein n=1 Tax=Methylomonas paludis TaxID=1173101 RepID=A0A975RAU9_9GAMM|nr:hypothetical protein [Methylomonas paludis]QWF71674.1 hypothetical protein KEF85_04140 [Methylomonas paludis]
MKSTILLINLMLISTYPLAQAGTLTSTDWTPANCGTKPQSPSIDGHDVSSYNQSVKALNEWQQQARIYYECLVKEANTDNAIIAESANRQQNEYRQNFENITSTIDAAKQKLEKK